MTTSESVTALVAALIDARPKFEAIVKGRTADIPTKAGGKYSYKYADLGDALDAVTQPLLDVGIIVTQSAEGDDANRIVVETRLMHTSGEWMASRLPMKPAAMDPQSVGSTITYARRYALIAMLGLATEDDDGVAGSHKGKTDVPKPAAAVPPAAPVADPQTTRKAIAIAVALQVIDDGLTPADAKRALRKWAFEQRVCDETIRNGFTPEHATQILAELEQRAEQRGLDVTPPDDGWRMNDAQRKRLMALHGELDHDSDERHMIYEQIVGKSSSSKFTRDDYDKVSRHLEALLPAGVL